MVAIVTGHFSRVKQIWFKCVSKFLTPSVATWHSTTFIWSLTKEHFRIPVKTYFFYLSNCLERPRFKKPNAPEIGLFLRAFWKNTVSKQVNFVIKVALRGQVHCFVAFIVYLYVHRVQGIWLCYLQNTVYLYYT